MHTLTIVLCLAPRITTGMIFWRCWRLHHCL